MTVRQILLLGTVVATVCAGCFFSSSPSPEMSRALNRYIYGGYLKEPRAVNQLLVSSGADRFIGRVATPLVKSKIHSRFGIRAGRMHTGIDFPAPIGTPVRAGCTGRVIIVNDDAGRYGKLLALLCDPVTLVYAHLDDFSVSPGDDVEQGEQIGFVGDTGNASGPHLHFEVRVRSKDGRFIAVNPLPFFQSPIASQTA